MNEPTQIQAEQATTDKAETGQTQADQTQADQTAPDQTRAAPSKFSRWKDRAANRIAPDAAKRQGTVTAMAMAMLGGRDKAIAFLNTHSGELAGRPLDLAVASEADCERVRVEINRLAAATEA
ncbi:MAG: DUF2384 domain-containing protein [Novosphingobium sp.]|jgi:hypothetical protein|nr:DUF2384 domain-containing protein [Novosphingobium sp.]